MKNVLTLLAAITLCCSQAFAQSSIQQSHIEANVPSASEFRTLLERDLLAYSVHQQLHLSQRFSSDFCGMALLNRVSRIPSTTPGSKR